MNWTDYFMGFARHAAVKSKDPSTQVGAVVIGPKATVGLGAVIFPGVEIGERAVVGACSLVPKDEKIPAGSVYVGVPARDIKGKA